MQKGRELFRQRNEGGGHIYMSVDWSCYRLLRTAVLKSFWSVTFREGIVFGGIEVVCAKGLLNLDLLRWRAMQK